MQLRFIRFFLLSAGILLFFTATAKIISGFGGDRVLARIDPLFQISYRDLFWISGVIELCVALICFFSKNAFLRVALLAWLATVFLIYHLSMTWVGYQQPCPCLGNFTGAIHMSPQAAANAIKVVSIYLFFGSYISFFWLSRQKRKIPPTSPL